MQKFALITLAIASLAVAHPARRTDGDTCNTGPTQCCEPATYILPLVRCFLIALCHIGNRVEQPSNLSGSTTALLSDLGVTLSGLLGDVGLNCNPITVIGTSNTWYVYISNEGKRMY